MKLKFWYSETHARQIRETYGRRYLVTINGSDLPYTSISHCKSDRPVCNYPDYQLVGVAPFNSIRVA
jgi:hypothetical protein